MKLLAITALLILAACATYEEPQLAANGTTEVTETPGDDPGIDTEVETTTDVLDCGQRQDLCPT